ncbi:AraC family transcriptional regulator [Craterilacuibacter sinensis]|uniref:Helix-turn-helix domain-containing protein n=1 Tax=Craterilacuibacter sinensis TaxID=2686017 RepID=A0A845BJU2_9NEIS|nr:AraC family transcriptional regulator [Craterilacuibacter sinensis]MXR36492.1 helix-turn-helix domain-containing protein [Craterilacuibacter sinensis]
MQTPPLCTDSPIEPTILASWVRALCQTLRGYDVDPDLLMQQCQMDTGLLHVPEARYPTKQVRLLWREAITHTNDPLLGLQMGKEIQAPSLHALGLAMLASANLAELMGLMARYCRILSSTMHMALKHDKKGSALVIKTLGGSEYNHAARIAMLAFVYRQACHLSQHPITPSFVALAIRTTPEQANRLEDYFGVPVTLEAAEDSIGFDYSTTLEPFAGANPMLLSLNEQAIRSYLGKIERMRFADRVLEQIRRTLPEGEPRLGDVAIRLGVSQRTLQRKLSHEQQSFQGLLDLARRQQAEDLLQHSTLPIVEIGYRLGFSDPSNFCRASNRWFGCSPSALRERSRLMAT